MVTAGLLPLLSFLADALLILHFFPQRVFPRSTKNTEETPGDGPVPQERRPDHTVRWCSGLWVSSGARNDSRCWGVSVVPVPARSLNMNPAKLLCDIASLIGNVAAWCLKHVYRWCIWGHIGSTGSYRIFLIKGQAGKFGFVHMGPISNMICHVQGVWFIM